MTRQISRNVIGIVLYALAGRAQTPPATLQITAPADQVVMHPGDVMQVTVVTVPVAGTPAVSQMALAFEGVGFAEPPAALPRVLTANAQKTFQISVPIPATTTPGPHMLCAIGMASGGNTIAGISNSITVNIERTDLPVGMVMEPALLLMTIPPDRSRAQSQIQGYLEYADGGRAPVPAGHLYFYPNSDYLNVNASGTVTALSPVQGQITAECVACPGVNNILTVNVSVIQQYIQAVASSLQATSAGGTYPIAMTTTGYSYSVTSDPWIHTVSSTATDSMHWTTSVTIDPNSSAQPRIGTLHFSIAAVSASQDVVVYQAGNQ